ncbi:hypothetical protein T265_04846 [Opisthorchis viverrini]|uniref:Uncharacterized protein n=1 Tax=Opisthorchis viverrini TaxID=6198 RepID=A0A075AG26_OPIVI|nr:hypothetical protein T265_04846 [Opisthorchis viverrini]KER28319.1 hypothetical protein T265_04846 [Opisthorchis viverrini]
MSHSSGDPGREQERVSSPHDHRTIAHRRNLPQGPDAGTVQARVPTGQNYSNGHIGEILRNSDRTHGSLNTFVRSNPRTNQDHPRSAARHRLFVGTSSTIKCLIVVGTGGSPPNLTEISPRFEFFGMGPDQALAVSTPTTPPPYFPTPGEFAVKQPPHFEHI